MERSKTRMKLKQLVKGLKEAVIKGSKEIEISGLSANSKLVGPGYLFVAKRGLKSDGNRFVRDAIQAGATSILSDIYDPSLGSITQIIHPDVVEAEAQLAANFYQNPSLELCMVGITGTSGKTTTSYAIRHIFETLNLQAGLIGTIEYAVGKNSYPAIRTTPDVITNHKLLKEMLKNGAQSCVMEVTSHALVQKRFAHIEYDIAVFTNLSHEHLDYHNTMEEYLKAKRILFENLAAKSECKKTAFPKMAVVNADSPWTEKLLEGLKLNVLSFGIEKQAHIVASDIRFTKEGSTFCVHTNDEKEEFFWPLVGRFNVYNALAAIGVGLTLGLSLEELVPILRNFYSAPGRLERIPNAQGLNIYVDYAHKVDALKNVLSTLRECTKGRLITLFGCGGDRDREKRPMMARAAEELSDVVIITSDNPRSEDPDAIIAEITSGFQHPERHLIEKDRAEAIKRAIELATPEDIVLLAGKGHETKQEFQHKVIDFDDRLHAKEYVDSLRIK